MGSIAEIITDLEFGRAKLLQATEGLSRRELTQISIFDDWTVKDVWGHIIGWDQWTLKNLPLILQDRAGEVEGIDPDSLNQQSYEIWRDKPLDEVLSTIQDTHQRILNIIASLDHKEIDMRHDRAGQTITIRSYVITLMIDHERQHAEEIQLWRETLDNAIDPEHIKTILSENRAKVLAAVDGLREADLLDKSAADGWSAKDVLAHIAAWEERILNGARHLLDPSQPAPKPIDSISGWNDEMAEQNAGRSWPDVWVYFTETRQDLDNFVDKLEWNDWKQRGPYPWPNNQGTLAELLTVVAEHDIEHISALEKWRSTVKQ